MTIHMDKNNAVKKIFASNSNLARSKEYVDSKWNCVRAALDGKREIGKNEILLLKEDFIVKRYRSHLDLYDPSGDLMFMIYFNVA